MKRTLRFVAAGLLVVLTFIAVSCGIVSKPRHNIVLIVIDTLRTDHLPFHGYEKNTAPFLSRLAEEGVVFERAHSTSSWTAPATASLVTSLHPIQHGVLTGFRATQMLRQANPSITLNRIPGETTTMAEVLKEAGYSTWAVSDNINVSYEQGFDEGFGKFRKTDFQGAATVNATVKGWAPAIQDREPYFLYLHYIDPHRPYEKQAPWYEPAEGELLDSISAYDSEINYVDQKISELFELMEWDKNTLVVVTSDHGEEFLDHGDWDHSRTLYGEVLDVPLVVYCPGEIPAAQRIAERVSILDILPTLRDFVGLAPSAVEQGISLLPALRGEGDLSGDRPHFSDLRSPPWYGSRVLRAVISGDEKYVLTEPGIEELYDLVADPDELHSLASARGDRCAEMRSELEEFEQSLVIYTHEEFGITLDEETLKKLESLGYIN
ncbi:sulfatase [bacterium]|nr:sulfatase [bacterium]